jgi:prepilin-type N-terminal cleavage/methylation domain-containing protein
MSWQVQVYFMNEKRDKNSRRRSSGFTLLELLVVVSIIIVVTAMAVPPVTAILRTYRLNNDARSLIGEINLARLRAASLGGRAEVICDTLTTGSTALTCGVAVRQLGATSFKGFTPKSLQTGTVTVDMPTQLRLTGTDSFGFPPAATSGAGMSSSKSGVTGQYQSTPFNCNAIVFNSRGLPIYDAYANIVSTCAPTTTADGSRMNTYVMYLQSGQSNYLAVVVDGNGNPSLWRWDSLSSAWRQFESGQKGDGTN